MKVFTKVENWEKWNWENRIRNKKKNKKKEMLELILKNF